MRNARLLMCMPYRQFLPKAAAAGFQIVSIWDPALEAAEYLEEVARLSEEMVLCDFRDPTELQRVVAATAARHDVGQVLHFGREATQAAVCAQADALGLAVTPPSSLENINDKSAMRRLLRARGLSPVFSIEAGSPRHARQLVRDGVELPIVVKPTGLDGSRAVRLVERVEDLDDWEAELEALEYRGPVLIEEYLRGPEFSVETLTAHGRHHVIGITAKRLGPAPHFVEMEHVHPAPLAAEDRAAIVELVVAYLDAAGYRFGPAHTELILTAAGPRIVESQARLGGDRIPLLLELATGFDIEAAVFHALAGAAIEPPPARRFAAISFFDFGTGRVRAVDGVDDVLRLPYVHALKLKFRRGDALLPVVSSETRHGYVVVDAESEQQAAERLATVRAALRVLTGARETAPHPLQTKDRT
jgi:biotin carboxylase